MAGSIALFGFLLVVSTAAKAQDVRTYVPPACWENLKVLKQAQRTHWPDHPDPATLPALGEHESCVSLKSARCCNPQAQLKSQREEGGGIPQITRTYRKDGSLRFDALQEIKEQHPVLRELTWENLYKRADLQNAVLTLKSRDNYVYFLQFVPDKAVALDFGDAGYNEGNGAVQRDRRACAITPGCDPKRWFQHVEMHCTNSHEALYGQRSACDINRHHVQDVRITRKAKYERLML